MKNTKKIFATFIIFCATVTIVGREFVMNAVALETSKCDDINAEIDEAVNCRLEINNSHFEQLASAHLSVNIPNNVTFVVTDEDWICTSTVSSVVCDKVYSVTFPMDTLKYVDVSFGAGHVGKYDISATVSGSGMNTVNIAYNDSIDALYYAEWCGDGECKEHVEDCESCAVDCGECGPVCGDDMCNGEEDCETCEEDCGVCEGGYCGDEVCDWGGDFGEAEDEESCPRDCGV